MEQPTILVTRRLPFVVERRLQEHFAVILPSTDGQMTPEGLQQALGRADGLLSTVTDRLTAEVLAAYPLRTKIVANFGVGVDNIDLAAARAHNIVVSNTPDVLTDCTADLAITLMLMILRRAGEGERLVRSGQWQGWYPTHLLGHRVTDRTLGIVGMGRIGRAVARRAAHGFGMRVLCFNRVPLDSKECQALGVESCGSLEELLGRSDIVSLHCPLNETTRGMINAARLAAMRPGSFLINTARGDLVDDEAVIAALKSGHLEGAGLDVFHGEPKLHRGYLELERVVLLPHLGSATMETREAMGMLAVDNLLAFFRGEPLPSRVI